MYTLNCGCTVSDIDDSVDVRWKDSICDADTGFSNAVAYGTYCKKCFESIGEDDIFIFTDEQADEWLRNGKEKEKPFERFDLKCLSDDGSSLVLSKDVDDPNHLNLIYKNFFGTQIAYMMVDKEGAEAIGRALFHFARSSSNTKF